MAALLAGILGAHGAGLLLRRIKLGSLANTVLGVVGGGVGGQVLMALGTRGGTEPLDGIEGQILAGGIGGAAMAALVSWVLHRR